MLKNRLVIISFGWVGGVVLITLLALTLNANPVSSQTLQNLEGLSGPTLAFTKTVGLSPVGCASTDTITVVGPANIIYCYAVKNTGDVTFTRNTLSDSRFGPLLNNIFLELSPGESTFFTVTLPVTQTTISTASWEAYDVANYIVDDNAPYDFIDISSFGTVITVGTNGATNVTIPFNTQLFNRDDHHLRVGMNGVIKHSSFNGSVNPTNDPLPSNEFQHAFIPFWDDLDNITGAIYQTVTGTAPIRSWIVQWDKVQHYNISGEVTDTVTFQAIITEGVSDILFQYADVDFNRPAWNGGRSATIGVQKNNSTAVQYSYNTASITNSMSIRFIPTFITATDSHTATVNVIPLLPNIELTKTVGTVPGVCALTSNVIVPADGGDVYYCYDVKNTGNVTLSLHDLDDSELGSIFNNLPFDLEPGQRLDTVSAGITVTQYITENTVGIANWTAYNTGPTDSVTATSAATVTLTPAPSIVLTKTAGLLPENCPASSTVTVPAGGGTVYYCYDVKNTGNVTLSIHTLFDDELGSIFDNLPYDLGPGQSLDTVSAGIMVSQNITQETVNTALWTAYNVGPVNVVTATATATATVDPIYRLYLPVLRKAPASSASLPNWIAPLLFIIPVFGLVIRRRAIL